MPPIVFSVGPTYSVQRVLGEGAYGIVASAIHLPTGRHVAVKKILPFDHTLFAMRTLREIMLLKYFTHAAINENIVSLLDVIRPPSLDDFNEVYLVEDLMEIDLHKVIKTQDITEEHAQYFIYQTLRALKSIHSADIVHRDLKPANLLINANCDLKVCDFGLARSVRTGYQDKDTSIMTEYVATRWYRAPEIMLSFKKYTKAIDIWSVGCILAELLSGKPLFPGRDYHHQLQLILDVTGTPTLTEHNDITSRRSRDYLRQLPIRRRKPFTALFPHASPLAIDFLTKTLTFDPKKRLTVEEALAHPYFEGYHDPSDEPSCESLDPNYFLFDMQKENLSKAQLKAMIYEQIQDVTPII